MRLQARSEFDNNGLHIPHCRTMKNLLSPKIFRQIKSVVTFLVKTLISRNFFGESKFFIFPHYTTVEKILVTL